MSQRRRPEAFDWSTVAIGVLVAAAGATVYIRDGHERFFAVLDSDLGLFGGMLLQVFAGCLIGALVTLLLPREAIERWVGAESGMLGLFVAWFAGIILPGGPFTIYAVAGAFLAIGADVGTAIVFITSWTLLGYTRALVWEFPFMGADFVIWRIIISLPLPIVAGLLGRMAAKIVMSRKQEPQ